MITTTRPPHAADEPEFVHTPAVRYLAIAGSGAPGTDEFYRKMALIGDVGRRLGDGSPPVIEIQYWYPDDSTPVEIADFYSVNPIPTLRYRILAAVSNETIAADLATARADAASGSERASDLLELVTMPPQHAVQVMHHGPFAEEFGTLARLGSFASDLGLRRSGPHHELHLDGFTRTTPQETLRTILRDPVVLVADGTAPDAAPPGTAASGTASVQSGVDAAAARAREIRALYEILERRLNGRVWSLHELMLGFSNDVGTVGRLILANEGTWPIEGDAPAQLQHKLAESLWWVMTIADRLNIDLADAFTATMDRIESGLGRAVGTDAG
jgi:NTP pyrophosphatase (non-canonical NTP hydrolase)